MRHDRHADVGRHRLWDILTMWLSACAMWVALGVHASAEQRIESPWLYRIARAPHSADVDVLLQRAEHHVQAGLLAFPTGYRVICERTLQLRLSVDSPAVRKGKRTALELFTQQARARRASLDRALAELARAGKLDPTRPDVARARARALVLWEEPTSTDSCQVRQRTQEAIDALHNWHALTPEHASSESLFQLGSLYAQLTAYSNAAAAYRRAVSLAFDDTERSAAYAQLAQVTMLAGDAAGALRYYERALEQAQPGRASALVRLGLAVALDRVGQHPAALEHAVKALEASDRSLDVISPDHVQFEPESEGYVYRALAHEALAQLTPDARTASLEAAAESYAAFLTRVDANHVYRNAAEADLRAVVTQLERTGTKAE